MQEFTQALIAFGGLVASIAVAVIALLRAKTKVANADVATKEKVAEAEAAAASASAERDKAQAALAEAQLAQQRNSIPPGGFDILTVVQQEFQSFRKEVMRRLDMLTARVDKVDAEHDATRGDVKFLQGKINGK